MSGDNVAIPTLMVTWMAAFLVGKAFASIELRNRSARAPADAIDV